ncbi:hypothetical protein PQX77_013678 [Marasmius sp. AFHP31]|nr:hypothetical protein PQX77_013678 [Marasmius sp. AFHP31]
MPPAPAPAPLQDAKRPPPSPAPGPPSKKQKAFDTAIGKIVKKRKAKKTRKKKAGTPKGTDAQLLAISRFYHRHAHPELRLETTVLQGLKSETACEEWQGLVVNNGDEDQPTIQDGNEDPFISQCIQSFNLLIERRPLFGEFVGHCTEHGNDEGFESVIAEMDRTCSKVLYNDNYTLKENLHHLMSPNPFTNLSAVQDLHHVIKADRNVHNDLICIYLLSHTDMLAYRDGDFDAQQEITEKYRSDEWLLDDDDLPTFLYDVNLAVAEPRRTGLFKSMFAIRCAQAILTSPLSAGLPPKTLTQAKRKNPNNTEVMGIISVTPELICWICMLIQFSLSSCQSWTQTTGEFSFRAFYEHLYEHFENEDKEFVDDIICFWNLHLYGHEKGRVDKAKAPCKPRPESDGAVLRREREERAGAEEARRKEAEEVAAAAAATAATGDGTAA